MGLGADAVARKYEAIETINKLISENDIKADEISVCRETVATCNEAVMKSNLMKSTILGMFQKILDLELYNTDVEKDEAYSWAEEHIPESLRKELGIEKPKYYQLVKYAPVVNLAVPANFTEAQIHEYAGKFLSKRCKAGDITSIIIEDEITSMFKESYENPVTDFTDEDFYVPDEGSIDYEEEVN